MSVRHNDREDCDDYNEAAARACTVSVWAIAIVWTLVLSLAIFFPGPAYHQAEGYQYPLRYPPGKASGTATNI
jgi:hypothetical protein